MYDTEKSTYNYIKVDKSCQMKYMKMHQNIRSECYWVTHVSTSIRSGAPRSTPHTDAERSRSPYHTAPTARIAPSLWCGTPTPTRGQSLPRLVRYPHGTLRSADLARSTADLD